MRGRSGIAVALAFGTMLVSACVGEGPGSDFDKDGLTDEIEDPNENFTRDPDETDFIRTDSDDDDLCDGQPRRTLTDCTGCEDCNRNGFWEPCLAEPDPLNFDTDHDGLSDSQDPAPVDAVPVDCSADSPEFRYGDSDPVDTPTPTPAPTATPTP